MHWNYIAAIICYCLASYVLARTIIWANTEWKRQQREYYRAVHNYLRRFGHKT